jgi:hypothetical protein
VPAVKFFGRLDLHQNSMFADEHQLTAIRRDPGEKALGVGMKNA